MVHDRELQLHDGTRLLRHDRYDELLSSGLAESDLEQSGVKRIHPGFRYVDTFFLFNKKITLYKRLKKEIYFLKTINK